MRVQIRSVDDEVSWDITSGFVISVKIVPNFQKTFTTNFQDR